jgi:hypothetical protein
MCWQCASNISQEQMVKQLDEIIKEPIKSFDYFNTTSVLTILYCTIGLFGEKSREISCEIMEQFIDYLHTKKLFYLPDTGFEPMYHPDLIKKIYWYAKNYDIDYAQIENEKYVNSVLEYLVIKFNKCEEELENIFIYKFYKFLSKPISKENSIFYYRTGLIIGIGLGLFIGNTYMCK